MKLLSLSVEHFRCVRKSRIEFGPGLNVLHGPNDLGKSSLATAIRAALLMQSSSAESKEFLSWHGSGDPHVELVFESEPQRIWRIRKTFGSDQAFLEESRDGVDFHVEARKRVVDGRLSEILRWGLAPPGPKGRPKGMPVTFLSTALLAEQDQVAEIFSKVLSKDSDESGKKRLIEALQAVAEDPVFKAVLKIVQATVSEAFLSSGQRRGGKDSPWIKAREETKRKEKDERDCSEPLQKTISIEGELQELSNRQLECETALKEVQEAFNSAEADQKNGTKRTEILGRLQSCNERVDQISEAFRKLAEAEGRHTELDHLTADLIEREKKARALCDKYIHLVEAKKEEIRVQTEDHSRDRQLKQSELEKRRAEVASEQSGNDAMITRIRAVEAIADRAQKAESAIIALAAATTDLRHRRDESLKVLRAADENERTLVGITHLAQGRDAQAGIEEARRGLAQIDAWREEASRNRGAATAVETLLGQTTFPPHAEVDAFKRLERELQIIRARLDVGLHVGVLPKRELRLSFRSDGGKSKRGVHDAFIETTGRREIQIEIDGVAEIMFSGGADDAREESVRLEKRWLTEVEPALNQAGVANVDDLDKAIQERARRLEEIRALRQAAEQLDQRISDQRDWASLRHDRQRDLAASESALNGLDRTVLEKAARALGINDERAADEQLARLRRERPRLVETERRLNEELVAADAQGAEKRQTLAAIHSELAEAQVGIEGDWRSLLSRLSGAQAELGDELKGVDHELSALAAGADQTLAAAREALGTLERERIAAAAEFLKITGELRQAEHDRDTTLGGLGILRANAERLDESAARKAVEQVEAELSLAPEQLRDVTEDTLTDLREGVQSARDALRRIEDAATKKQGALQHVGGEVAKERSEVAQEALKLAREHERSLETDYDAWALLRETLLEAEQEEGVHLGRVLGDPVFRRFGELTDGRYGKLTLGPDLETDTISVAGEGRSLKSLSIGTRDQLSILFRLTLAEQLGSTVVLDDQLTQSDPQRMAWVRDLIRQMAEKIQIVVFTCRPGDYLLPSELKPARKTERFNASIRSVDLTQVIERSGPEGSADSSG